jgi:hypothetical protein
LKLLTNLSAARRIFVDTRRFSSLRKPNLKNDSGIALIEMNMDFSSHAAYALLAKTISKNSVRFVGYSHVPIYDLGSLIKWQLAIRIPALFAAQRSNYLYSRIGIKRFVKPDLVINSSNIVLPSKRDVLNLEVENIPIGDLFYDFHLAKRGVGTIDLNSTHFRQDLEEFLAITQFWKKFFSTHNVEYVFTSHSVYTQGLVGRVGISFGAKVFVVNHERLYKLSSGNLLSDCESKFYSPHTKFQFGHSVDIERGTLELDKVMSGLPQPSSHHGLVNGFIGDKEVQIEENELPNVMVAAHCFSDSPNALGPQLFPDFLEWLEFLGLMSKKVNANWYIKEHPAFNENDFEIFNDFLTRHPQLRRIPRSVSNRLLFRGKIDLVLTVHGTIAVEAAWNGVKVINSSINSPHANYDFSVTPKSITEYQDLLESLNFDSLRKIPEPSREEIAHFFDLHHIRRSKYWLYGDSTSLFVGRNLNYKSRIQSLSSFTFWCQNFASSTSNLEKEVEAFINSNKYIF